MKFFIVSYIKAIPTLLSLKFLRQTVACNCHTELTHCIIFCGKIPEFLLTERGWTCPCLLLIKKVGGSAVIMIVYYMETGGRRAGRGFAMTMLGYKRGDGHDPIFLKRIL